MSEWTIERYGNYNSTARIVCDGRPVSKRMSAEHASTIAKNHNALCSNPTPALTLARDALVDVKAAYAAQVAASVDQLKELRALKMGAMTGCAGVAERLEIERQFKHMEYHLIKIDAALSAINAELKE